jgi:cysteine-rich repeat protein
MTIAGNVIAGSLAAKGGGGASIYAGGTLSVAGSVTVAGNEAGLLDIEACRSTLASGAMLRNASNAGSNQLRIDESLELLGGSELISEEGSNRIAYRSNPPVLLGSVSPAPELVVDPAIDGCPICGNAVRERGELCDDGNLLDGDGCSSFCMPEQSFTDRKTERSAAARRPYRGAAR